MAKDNGYVHSSFWANIFKTAPDRMELEQSLLAIPPFQSLTKRELDMLFTIIHNRSYLAGEYIFYQGDPGIGLYIIREGEVKIERKDESGDAIQLAYLKKGDFLGELALVDGEKRSASALAVTDVRLAVIFKPDLDEFIEEYPKKGIKILQGISHIMAGRLRALNEEYFSQISKSKTKSESNYGT